MTDTPETPEMNKNLRYYVLHRDKCNEQRLARYYNNPAVIARREEKERIRAEKKVALDAEKERKKVERELRKVQLKALALATRKASKAPEAFLIDLKPLAEV